MNKYLLLRDNKQSGPYTVPEIIDKGIKPYDLVWLEGKSAAWRYPSEVDELKAHAPAVEEQPFDRFYKKPEAGTAIPAQQEKIFRSEAKLTAETISKKIKAVPKKVYINFPGGQKRMPVYQETKADHLPAAAVASGKEPVAAQEPTPIFPAPPASEEKLLNTVIIACCVLVLIISVLIVNYGNQRSNIRQLNDMVQQMEKRQNAQNQAAKAALDSRAIPVRQTVPATGDGSSPMASGSLANNTNGEKPATRHATIPAEALNQTKSVIKEQQESPVGPAKTAASPKEPTKESLFNLVSVRPNKYRTGILGGISDLQFVLTNTSPQTLRKVAVEIRYLSRDKKVLTTQTVYFENVPPGAQRILDVPKTSRGVNIDYSITDIQG